MVLERKIMLAAAAVCAFLVPVLAAAGDTRWMENGSMGSSCIISTAYFWVTQ
jgi:hypothetical protein